MYESLFKFWHKVIYIYIYIYIYISYKDIILQISPLNIHSRMFSLDWRCSSTRLNDWRYTHTQLATASISAEVFRIFIWIQKQFIRFFNPYTSIHISTSYYPPILSLSADIKAITRENDTSVHFSCQKHSHTLSMAGYITLRNVTWANRL